MKQNVHNTLLRIALGAWIFTGNALVAMELCEEDPTAEAWLELQEAVDTGTLKKPAQCERIKKLLTSHPSLHLDCFRHVAEQHPHLLKRDLWLLKACLDYCTTNEKDYAALKSHNTAQLGDLKGLLEILNKEKNDLIDSIHNLTEKKTLLISKKAVASSALTAQIFANDITQVEAKLAKRTTQKDMAQSIQEGIVSLLQQSQVTAPPKLVSEVKALLREQTQDDKSSSPSITAGLGRLYW